MKRGIVFLLILLLILISNCSSSIKKVCFEDNCFGVEIAATTEEKATGLMNRPFLEENKGMLFLYDKENIYSFWMKNTLIPLDIIWISKEEKVVFIKENAQPCTETCPPVSPDKKAAYVLEVNSGLVKKLNIKLGDKAEIIL